MSHQNIIDILKGLKKTSDELSILRIDNIIDLVKILPEDDWTKIPSIKFLISIDNAPSSVLNNIPSLLIQMLDELRALKRDEQIQVKEMTIVDMRKSRRGVVIGVTAILIAIACCAIVLGVLSAFGNISGVWCDIVGVVDCMFGIVFFVYELYDDKIKESKINCGDVETIQKYLNPDRLNKFALKTGDISGNSGGFSNSGFVFGKVNVGMSQKEITAILDSLFKN